MGVHRIAVISDTHGVVRDRVRDITDSCEVLCHCGDFDDSSTYGFFSALSQPLYAVRGNADRWQGADELEASLQFELFGLRFFMTHKKADIPQDVSADVVLCGHTHRYEEYRRDGRLYLNPGASGAGRLFLPVTMAVLTVGDGISVQRIDLDSAVSDDVSQVTVQLVKKICRDVDRGYTAREISERHAVDESIAAQIARLYVTHPGVTPDGIMTKLGL